MNEYQNTTHYGISQFSNTANQSAGKLGLIGESSYICNLRDEIRRVAWGDFPVLIQGDSGTGKEIIAKAIHSCSKRSAAKMVAINCAAIPKHLEESEFFGHAKGAFTGAYSSKEGIVVSANNSTLFLDEVGEISLETQAKLLRVLDTGEFISIGKTTPQKVNIRIISATNRNLEEMVKKGLFRDDLYFRLKGAVISTKPLREHKEDIPYLVEYFLYLSDNNERPRELSAEAMDLLIRYDWPGNIRELKYTIDVISIASIGMNKINADIVRSVLKINDEVQPMQHLPYKNAKAKVIQEFEIHYFTKLLHRYRGNLNQAAKCAGMYRPNLVKKLQQLNISADAFRPKK